MALDETTLEIMAGVMVGRGRIGVFMVVYEEVDVRLRDLLSVLFGGLQEINSENQRVDDRVRDKQPRNDAPELGLPQSGGIARLLGLADPLHVVAGGDHAPDGVVEEDEEDDGIERAEVAGVHGIFFDRFVKLSGSRAFDANTLHHSGKETSPN
jgi:hypothetical protein